MAKDICIDCNKEFEHKSHAHRKRCDACGRENMIGNTRGFKKGQKAWNKGKPAPWAIIPKPRYGKDNHNWKGDKVGLSALHNWVRVRLAKPLGCQFCGKIRKLDLANKSHQYKRELTDWAFLCRPCHAKYDDYVNKSWETKRRRVAPLRT